MHQIALATVATLLVASSTLALSAAERQTTAENVRVESVTRPSADLALALTVPGQVATVHVEPGDAIRAGDPILSLDDTLARLDLAQATAAAESTAALDAAEATLALTETELARVTTLRERDGAARFEVERKQLEVDQARARVEIQRQAVARAALARDAAQARLERLTLRAPADGVVETITADTGETVQALAPVARLVDTDPLELEAATPTWRTLTIDVGDPAWIRPTTSADAPNVDWIDGVVTSLARVADAGSETRGVRIEIPNPDDLPAGTRVTVTFDRPPLPSPDAAAPTTADQTRTRR